MGSRITSYNALVSAVVETLEDDGAELASYVQTAVDNAEQRISREIDTLGMVLTATVTAASSTATITKPTGARLSHDLWYVSPTTGERVILKKKDYSYILDYWPIASSVGEPKYYADIDTSVIILAPTPNASIGMTYRYEGRPAALTSTNQTNYFTEQCSDALFYATMIEISNFTRNYNLAKIYEEKYANARDTLINEGRRQRRDDTGMQVNIAATNTLKKDDV